MIRPRSGDFYHVFFYQVVYPVTSASVKYTPAPMALLCLINAGIRVKHVSKKGPLVCVIWTMVESRVDNLLWTWKLELENSLLDKIAHSKLH